ncbi:MAG: ankyrin repeat domain-containing protein [Chitinophagaceae bacterium]
MRYAFFLGAFLMICMAGLAQKNSLLEPGFWQGKPGVELVKAEVTKGNNPAEPNSNNFDPVVLAINSGAPNETVKYLLDQKGNDVSKLTHDGRTYIFWAASKGNTELMEYFLAKGARVNMEDNHGYTVLNFAANGGQQDTKVYDLCITNGADIKKDLTHDGANALLLAVTADSTGKLVEYFTSKGLSLKSVDAQGNTAFNYAARAGNIPLMKSLLAKGVKPTDNAMILASQGTRRGANKPEVFQYLESVGIKPDVIAKNGQNALHAIVRRPGQEQLISYFLSKGVKIDQADEEGNTVFISAAASNRDLATLALLKAEVKDINKTNKAGMTALTLAVKGNSPEVVKYLIDNGANVNVVDAKGDNLTAYLVDSYNPRQAKEFQPKLKILIAAGLDPSRQQENGNTLWHLAIVKNDLGLLQQVSSLAGDVNVRNKEGLTVLHKAAMLAKDEAILKYLLSVGAQKEIQTSFNETAFDLASENENFSKQHITLEFLK